MSNSALDYFKQAEQMVSDATSELIYIENDLRPNLSEEYWKVIKRGLEEGKRNIEGVEKLIEDGKLKGRG